MEMNRRSFIAGSALAGLGASAAASFAVADEASAPAAGFEWPGAAPDIEDDQIVETLDADILVCGAGHAGMIAAVSATVEGAKTVVIEKNAMVGTTRSYIGAIDDDANLIAWESPALRPWKGRGRRSRMSLTTIDGRSAGPAGGRPPCLSILPFSASTATPGPPPSAR